MKVDSNTKIYEFDGTTAAGVYIGFLDRLVYVGNILKWNEEEVKEIGEKFTFLTLREIREQLEGAMIVTVIVNRPTSGAVYQCGNYKDNEWYKIGELNGYA